MVANDHDTGPSVGGGKSLWVNSAHASVGAVAATARDSLLKRQTKDLIACEAIESLVRPRWVFS